MGSYLPFVDLGTNKALQVATGNGFTCALLYNFGLFKKVIKCWGRNTFGQLGLGHTSNQGNVPNDAFPSVDLGPGFEPVQVIVGVDRSCALSLSNSVKCWGRGSYGKLGYEDTLSRGTASSQMGINLLPISLGTGFNFNVIQIAIGEDHSCALSADNTVKCWGRNNFGQLGIGDTLTRGDSVGDMGNNLAPVQLGFDTIQITTGAFHSCALSNNNDVKCWGKNTGGQLGAGDTLNRGDGAIPMLSLIPIALGSAFGPPMHIEAGYSHVCAVSMFDKVKCWGGNTFGELGLEHTINMGVEPDDMADNLPVVDLVFIAPTPDPTDSPTKHPSINPTSNPSINPSFHPSNNPTIMPTNSPTRPPSVHPSTTPTASPSNNPTNIPSRNPTVNPSESSSRNPTVIPSLTPSKIPTETPTANPSISPSNNPTTPTTKPSNIPTTTPLNLPTKTRSNNPTINPSNHPTMSPSNNPTKTPSNVPTATPSNSPSTLPTINPSNIPTIDPTKAPTTQPPTQSPLGDGETATPTGSPTPTRFPTAQPITKRPTAYGETLPPTLLPTASPSRAPVTSDPTESPVTTASPVTANPTAASLTPTASPVETCAVDNSLGRVDCDDGNVPDGQCSVLFKVSFDVCYVEPYMNKRGTLWTNMKTCACSDVF
eukprot:557432_1